MEQIFEEVLKENRKYVALVEENADAEAQTKQLNICGTIMRTQIIEKGMAKEYAEYCERKIAIKKLRNR